ncbi:MAG: lysylphosphatidylglycerol synthase transmembrane domain-containing protein [Candidatus Paceibacterota bacterium]|jgi:hypothetical protein
MDKNIKWQKTGKILKILFSLFLFVCVILVLKINLPSVLVFIKNIPVVYIFSALLVYLLAVFVASIKWRLFLPNYSIRRILRYTFVGQFYSVILPGQFVGEAAKAYRLGAVNKNLEEVGASVLLDKATGILGILIVAFVGIVFTGSFLPPALLYIILFGLIICVLVLLLLRREEVYVFVHRKILSAEDRHLALNSFLRFIRIFVEHWHEYSRRTGRLLLSVFAGVIYQLLIVALIAILASGLNIYLSFFDWSWIFGIVSVSVFIPVTIGGIGLREGVFVGLLSLLHVSPELAVSLSLASFAFQLLGALIGGTFEAMELKNR